MTQERIDWKADYAAALAEARRDGKLIVVHFMIEGRPACVSMEEETLRHADVVAASKRFVGVKVDVDRRPDFYQGTVGGRGGLATCVLDTTNDVVSAVTGFIPADEYVRFLVRAERGHAALREAREAAASRPGDADSMSALAETYLRLESRRRAEECYEGAIQLGAKAGKAGASMVLCHERLARLAVVRGRNKEARGHLAEVRRLDPEGKTGKADRLLLTEAIALGIERRHLEAVRLLEDGLKGHPASEEADYMRFVLGFVLHQLPDDKRALEVLEDLVRSFPASAWIKTAKEQIGHIKNPQPDHTH
jgi:tetratricopeptide (TPR) repeat protein